MTRILQRCKPTYAFFKFSQSMYFDERSSSMFFQDIKRFMDEAYEGVIYFSLGSYIEPKMFKENVRRVFEETMKKSKYRVIWKHSEPIQGSPKNILHKSWLPQNEILGKILYPRVFEYLFKIRYLVKRILRFRGKCFGELNG